ncbi:MAG: hypothetical protein AAF721_19680, partial [Myxococcota bacterium]
LTRLGSTAATTAATLLAGLLTVACGAEDSGRGGGGMCGGAKCDEVEGGTSGGESGDRSEFLEAIGDCENAAERKRGRTHDERYDALVGIERSRTSCLQRANDDIVPSIDKTVGGRNEELSGKLSGQFGRYRDARGMLCTTLVEASEHATEKSGPLAEEACSAQSELDVAALISAYVDLGTNAVKLAESRVRYPACWDSYDDAIKDASVASQTEEATEGLLACIVEANDGVRSQLVTKIQEQFPGRTSETLEDDTQRAMRSHGNAMEDICEAFTAAGPTVDATEIGLNWLHCQIQGNSMVGHLGDKLVPGVWPEGAESKPGDDGNGDGDDDGGDEGGSTGGGEDTGDSGDGDSTGGSTSG